MAVEIFTKAQFEAALPRHKVTGDPLWVFAGIVAGEYVYNIRVSDDAVIVIRSSVREDGVSAAKGEDSIRLWLASYSTGKPLSSKITRWIARTGGWRERLTEQCRTLYKLGRKLGPCPKCGAARALRKVAKEGANKGRLFFTCDNDHFEWAE